MWLADKKQTSTAIIFYQTAVKGITSFKPIIPFHARVRLPFSLNKSSRPLSPNILLSIR
jgi:hypothetical protein